MSTVRKLHRPNKKWNQGIPKSGTKEGTSQYWDSITN